MRRVAWRDSHTCLLFSAFSAWIAAMSARDGFADWWLFVMLTGFWLLLTFAYSRKEMKCDER